MQDYPDITNHLRQVALEIKKNKTLFTSFIQNISAYNGQVPTVKDVSIETEASLIKVSFVDLKFEVIASYKRSSNTPQHSLEIYGFNFDNKRVLLHSESFSSNGEVAGLSMSDDIESMAILLNLVDSALQS